LATRPSPTRTFCIFKSPWMTGYGRMECKYSMPQTTPWARNNLFDKSTGYKHCTLSCKCMRLSNVAQIQSLKLTKWWTSRPHRPTWAHMHVFESPVMTSVSIAAYNTDNPTLRRFTRNNWSIWGNPIIMFKIDVDKKLSYRRVTARCVLSVVVLPITTQQCRNYLYDKSWPNRWHEVGGLVGGNVS